MLLYRIILYLCAAAAVAIIAGRLFRAAARRHGQSPGAARVVNEIIWTAIPAAVLAWLVLRR